MPLDHDWTRSTLGHGEMMCRRCFMTNREAMVLGMVCEVPLPAPANEDAPKEGTPNG